MPLNLGRRAAQTPDSALESIDITRAVPIISDEAVFNLALTGAAAPQGLMQLIQKESACPDALSPGAVTGATFKDMVEAWAQNACYPTKMAERDNLAKISRYYKLAQQKANAMLPTPTMFTDSDLKADFFEFVKLFLYYVAQADGAPAETLDDVDKQRDKLWASDFADHLGYPNFNQHPDNPLLVLADLPFSTYLTTSPYRFLEAALVGARKTPRSAFCDWHGDYPDVKSPLAEAWEPSAHEPLVYHLYGLDMYPRSLVLTDDDYLDFLFNVAHNKDDDRKDLLPAKVREMFSRDLLVMGYSLNTSAFRALYAGIIKPTLPASERRGVCSLQVLPTQEEFGYLRDYLQREAKFDPYIGDVASYAEELRKQVTTPAGG